MEVEPDISSFLQSTMQEGDDPIKLEKCTVDDSLYPTDIEAKEKEYYKRKYPELADIKTERLHCTSCDKHLGSHVNSPERVQSHPIIQVLLCNSCSGFYNSGDFEKGEDGSELYCRWCGQGGEVYCCSGCPFVFCKMCITRNLPEDTIMEIEKIDDWLCFKCFPKPLYELRAKCWALRTYIQEQNKLLKNKDVPLDKRHDALTDHSTCCRNRAAAKAKPKLYDAEYCPSEEDADDTEYVPSAKSRKSKPSRKRSSTSRSKNASPKRLCLPGQTEMSILPHPTYTDTKMPSGEQQDEVVCTPDIFSCLMDNEEGLSTTLPNTGSAEDSQPCKSPPPLVQFAPVNGNQPMPRISVRPAASMQAPPRVLNNNQVMHPRIPMMMPQVAIRSQMHFRPAQQAPGMMQNVRTINVSANNLYQLTDGRIVQVTRVNNNVGGPQSAPTVPVQAPTNKGSYIKPKPGSALNAQNKPSVGQRPAMTNAVASTSTATSRTVPVVNRGVLNTKNNAAASKTLVANNNVNRIRMRKVPDWFNQRIQQCISIARTFINQLMDFRCNLLTMNDISYDEVKNLHVQLSFLMSTVIGKYKNSQNDLNTRLTEWTEALCTSLQEAIKPGTSTTTATSPVPCTSATVPPPAPAPAAAANKPDQAAGGILKAALGYAETKALDAKILAKFTDKKLQMLPQVKLSKFKYDPNSKVVFRVKQISKRVVGGRGGPGSRVPLVKIIDHTKKKPIFSDPNVVNEILDSDDDDVVLVPSEGPVLITLDSDEETDAPKAKTTTAEASTDTSDKPAEDVTKDPVESKTNTDTQTEIDSTNNQRLENDQVDETDEAEKENKEHVNKCDDEANNVETNNEIGSKDIAKEEDIGIDESSRDENPVNNEKGTENNSDEPKNSAENLEQDQTSKESEVSQDTPNEALDQTSTFTLKQEEPMDTEEERVVPMELETNSGNEERASENRDSENEDIDGNRNSDNMSEEDMDIDQTILNEDNTNDTNVDESYKNGNDSLDNLEEHNPVSDVGDTISTEGNNFVKIVDPTIFTENGGATEQSDSLSQSNDKDSADKTSINPDASCFSENEASNNNCDNV